MNRRIVSLFVLLAGMITFFTTCKDDDDEEVKLDVETTSLRFSSDYGEDELEISCNGNWTVEVSESWCEVSQYKGSGNTTLDVFVSKNKTTSSRKCEITISAGDKEASVLVRQNGKEDTETEPGGEGETEGDDNKENEKYKVTVRIEPEGAGTVTGLKSEYAYMDQVSLTFKASSGYSFLRWEKSDGYSKTDDECSFYVRSNTELTAYFGKLCQYGFSVNGGKGGAVTLVVSEHLSYSVTTSKTGYLVENSEVKLVAEPAIGYEFEKWSDGTTDKEKSVVITEGVKVEAFFKETSLSGVEASGTLGGHDYVDLGLPSNTKWATCNMGATKASDRGSFFAWGETETKTSFTAENYKFFAKKNDAGKNDINVYSKYCKANGSVKDGLGVLESSDDAAYVNWGKSWKMPSFEDWKELVDNCEWSFTTLNGVGGYKVTGPNGKFIFLPYSSVQVEGQVLSDYNNRGVYWTSSSFSKYNTPAMDDFALMIWFSRNESTEVNLSTKDWAEYRVHGVVIRPVAR